MAFDDRRRPNIVRKVMWGSLVLNLFLIGAITGNIVAEENGLRGFIRGERPPGIDENGPPPPLRMLNDLRGQLSPEGKAIFDTEFTPLTEKILKRRKDVEALKDLRQVLLRDDATDEEIRHAFTRMKMDIGDDFGRILTHMGNVAVKLSPSDRAELALHRPGPPPSPSGQ